MLFKADFAFGSVKDISVAFLKKHNIKGLLLDLDNTLTTHDNPVPAHGIKEWVDKMKKCMFCINCMNIKRTMKRTALRCCIL